jgi:hypothetical protein
VTEHTVSSRTSLPRACPAFERRIITAIAEAMFPPVAGMPAVDVEAGILEAVHQRLLLLPVPSRRRFRALFLALELSPFLSFTFRPFSRLSPERRLRILRRWERSRLYACRLGMFFLKYLLGGAYLEGRSVRDAMHLSVAPRSLPPSADVL